MLSLAICADEVPPIKRRRLGKVSHTVLSQDMELHRFVQYVKNRPRTWKESVSTCSWAGVKCNSEHEQIIALDWQQSGLRGNLSWSYLPSTITELYICNPWTSLDFLVGDIDFSAIPSATEKFYVQNHHFTTQSLDFSFLPKSLKELAAGKNHLGAGHPGNLVLTRLSPVLELLNLDSNAISGNVDLTNLPISRFQLCLSNNELSGNIDLSHLPPNLVRLNLESNHFSGNVTIGNTACGIHRILLRNNHFEQFVYNGTVPRYLYNSQGTILQCKRCQSRCAL